MGLRGRSLAGNLRDSKTARARFRHSLKVYKRLRGDKSVRGDKDVELLPCQLYFEEALNCFAAAVGGRNVGFTPGSSHFVPSRTVMTLVATGDRIETLARRLWTAPDRSCRNSSRLLRFACHRDRFSQSRSGAVMG